MAQRVGDFVSAGLVQVFSLEPNLRSAVVIGQPPGKVQRRRTPDELVQQVVQLRLKFWVFLSRLILLFHLIKRLDQSLGDVATTKFAKTSLAIRQLRIAFFGINAQFKTLFGMAR